MSQDSLGFPRVHYGLLGFARISQGLTRRNKVAQGLTRSQKVPHFSRCCLSERSRKAMHEGRFPFFSRPLRSLTIQARLSTFSWPEEVFLSPQLLEREICAIAASEYLALWSAQTITLGWAGCPMFKATPTSCHIAPVWCHAGGRVHADRIRN